MTTFNYNYWLDEYNDYIRLYKMFGDEEYLVEANEVRNSLLAMVRRLDHTTNITQCINNNDIQKFKFAP